MKINLLIILAIVGFSLFVLADSQENLEAELAQLEGGLITEGYNWLINYSGNTTSIFYENYSCSSTGYHTVKVLTEGAHHQLFEFGNFSAGAHNWAKDGSSYTCSNCSDCNSAIMDSNAGDVIHLTQDITNHAGNCIIINKSDVHFDGGGHTIDGTGSDYGIYVNASLQSLTDITIRNCTVTGFYHGINSMDSSYYIENLLVTDVNASGNNKRGFQIYYLDNATLKNIIADSNSQYGFYGRYIYNSTFQNITMVFSGNGFYFVDSNYNNFSDITANSCFQYGLYFIDTNYNTFTNITANSNIYGFGVIGNNNNLENITTNSNSDEGIQINGNNNNLENITANSNEYGVLVTGDNNNITNVTANSNKYGIEIAKSANAVLKNCSMQDNDYGLFISSDISSPVLEHFIHDIDTANAIDGKPIYYWVNEKDREINSTMSVSYVGVVNSTNITVRDLNLTKNGQGVLFAWTDNSLIENITLSQNYHGIYTEHADNNSISGITATSNEESGIYLRYSNYTTLQNITANSNKYGVYFLRTDNSNLSNAVLNSNSYDGVYLSGDNNILTNITANSNSNYGVCLYTSDNNNLSDVISNSNSNYGVYLSVSDNNILTNITANSNSNYGVYLYADNNTLTNVTANSNSQRGFYIYNAHNNTLQNLTVQFNPTGLYFSGSSWTEVSGSSISKNSGNDIHLLDPSYHNLFYNNSFVTRDRVGYPDSSDWNNSLTGNHWLRYDAESEGCIDADTDGFCDEPYVLNANATDYKPIYTGWATEEYNCSSCSECNSLIQTAAAGEIVTLDTPITNQDGHCIEFSGADDITFDCQGNTINGDDDSTGNGIYLSSGSHRNTIQNCPNVSDFYHGVNVRESNYTTLQNITAISNYYGIQSQYSDRGVFKDVTVNSNDDYGIYFIESSYSNLTGVTVNSNDDNGIYFYVSSYNNLTNVTTNLNKARGIYFSNGGNNILINTTTNSNFFEGIYLFASSNNILENITANSNSLYGLMFGNSDSNTINNSNIENNVIAGLWLNNYSDDSKHNKIYNSIFNNNQNIKLDMNIIGENYFNTTLNCTGDVNIINGSCMGGNYWAFPNGTGYSQTCVDTDGNGVCDEAFNLTNNNSIAYDYHPLTHINLPPNTPSPEIISVEGTNKTASDLNCSALITDDLGGTLNVSVQWFKNGGLNLTVDYNNGYPNATMFGAILESGNTTKHENWSCAMRLYDHKEYSGWGNSSNLTILNSVPNITLNLPFDGTATTDRTPTFSWDGTDDDGDSLTYDFNITKQGSGLCSDYGRSETGWGSESYTHGTDLKCLYDNLNYYVWKVKAYDDESSSEWSENRTVNISALLAISLPVNSVDFHSIVPSTSNDTTDNSPPPFVLQNDGNCLMNVSVEAGDLWASSANPSTNYRFKVDNITGEEGAFNWLASLISWTNMPTITGAIIGIAELKYPDSADSAEVDIFISTPANEPPSVRSSTVTFVSELAE